MEGIVISSTGSWFEVAAVGEAGAPSVAPSVVPSVSPSVSPPVSPSGINFQDIAMCKVRGNFRLKGVKTTNPVAVGDYVVYRPDPGLEAAFPDRKCGWITEVRERRNCIIRKSVNLSKQTHIIAANIDMAFLVASLTYPRTPRGFIDRFLVSAEAYRVPVTIVFNKIDLYGPEEMEELEEFARVYPPLGYEVLRTSATQGIGLESLQERLSHRVCLFSGNSGVGKSALVHALDPELDIRIGDVSETHLKGKHTTTYARMYPFGHSYLIDTPGIREFGMVQLKTDEVSLYFPEMRALIPECRFNNCTHTHEPGCAVKKAVEDGRITPLRYKSYLNILNGDEVPVPGLIANKKDRK